MGPHVFIKQHDSCFYEWALQCSNETVGLDVGLSNIQDCIRGAMDAMPNGRYLIEISYNGVHMGAYPQTELMESAPFISGQIAHRFREVAPML